MSLSEIYEKSRQHKLLLICITIAFFVALVFIALFIRYLVFAYPVNQISQYGITNATKEAELINQYRITSIQLIAILIQTLGGIAVGVGIYFAWGNLVTARESQITESFTRAVDQLGNDKLEVRVGGIYALERIANKSEKDYWPIMEILTAYVRENSACDEHGNLKVKHDKSQNETSSNTINKVSSLDTTNGISLDIQAILTVIKRRNYSFNTGEPYGLDLRNAYLYKADLSGAHLEGANLINTNLSHADLRKAHLERINVQSILPLKATKTNLEKANLEGAYLEGSNLTLANLKEAHLDEAHLKGADISLANLDGANLRGADLDEKLHIKLNEKYPHFAEDGRCK